MSNNSAQYDLSAYDQAMGLIKDQTAALAATREALEQCQAQNQQLIADLRFYADRDNWRTRLAHLDAGDRARVIIQKIMGR